MCRSPSVGHSLGAVRLGCGGSQVLLREADKFPKPRRVFDRHVREDFAIEGDIGLLEGVDEPTVGHSLGSDCRADASDPQLPEVALSVFATGVGVGQTLIYAFCR